ncbi:MAG: hypothetical protein ACD_56C00023G0004 [uncultured bacterium]|nr:MAG: hypothetical protein ACD_56C00023G0004 [uncultured bacterium]
MQNAVEALSTRKLRDQLILSNAQNLARLFQGKLDSENPQFLSATTSELECIHDSIDDSLQESNEEQIVISSMTDEILETETIQIENESQTSTEQRAEDKKTSKPRRKKVMKKNVATVTTEEDVAERIVIHHEDSIYFARTENIEEKCVWLLNNFERDVAFEKLPKTGEYKKIKAIMVKLKLLQTGGFMCDEMVRIFPFSGPTGCNGIIITAEMKKALEEMHLPGLFGYFK